MKKHYDKKYRYLSFVKFDLKMKLNVLFVFTSFFTSLASTGYPQSVTLALKNTTVEEVINKIELTSKYTFVYNTKSVDLKRKISINEKKASIENVLNELFNETQTSFKIVNAEIFLQKRESVKKMKIEQSSIENTQEYKIKGMVQDSNGQPLPGANIIERGTNNGTQSDFDGKFSLNVADDNATLVISYLGFLTQEVAINYETDITIALLEDTANLNEVVVIGYGKQSKAKVTGAISSISNADLENINVASFEQQLVGKLAGVQINTVNGSPGEDSQVVIRGTGTLTAGTNPLLVVDGIPLAEGSSLSSINPNDIAKIDILKDAASAAIYGSRGANGVIIITTKKGKYGKLKVEYNAYTGWQSRADKMQYANAYESAQFLTEGRDYGYISRDPVNRSINDERATRIANGANLRELRLNYLDPYLNGTPGLTNTDWMDEIFRLGAISNHSLALSGANEKSDFYVSGNYFEQEGIAIETDFKRFSGIIKANHKFNDMFRVGFSINPSYSKQNAFKKIGNWSQDPISMTITAYPFFEVYNPDGSLNISEQHEANRPEDGALQENPVAWATNVKSEYTNTRTFGNFHLNYQPIDGLTIKAMVAGDFRKRLYDYFNPSFVGTYRRPAPKQAEAYEANRTSTNILTEFTANYSKRFINHFIDIIGGYTYQQEEGSSSSIKGNGFTDDNVTNIGGASTFGVSSDRYKWTLISYLARAQYAYKDKYLLSAAIRRDGSSRFGANNKWAVFPSFSAGWILSKEEFLKKKEVLTFAKIRASWGKTGNNQIGSYSSQSLIESSNYVFNNLVSPGKIKDTAPNADLSWETNTSYNVGVDLGLLNKLNLSIEYYSSKTNDLLLNVPVPEQSGFSTSLQNLGETKNTGFEFQLSGSNFKIGQVEIGFNGNWTSNSNEVISLGDQNRIATGKQSAFVTEVGEPIAMITGYNVTGVYKTQAEIDASPHLPGTLPGDYIVTDVNSNNVIDENDKTAQGTYAPDFTYGLGLNLNYKNFDFNISAYGVEGRTIYDRSLAFLLESGEGFGIPTKYYFDNRYHPENNPNGFFAQPNTGNFSSARRETRASNIAFTSGDFFRIRSMTLGYKLPSELLERLTIGYLRFYITANNPFTVTDFLGYNLEQSSKKPLTAGFGTWGGYGTPKSCVLGINLKL